MKTSLNKLLVENDAHKSASMKNEFFRMMLIELFAIMIKKKNFFSTYQIPDQREQNVQD